LKFFTKQKLYLFGYVFDVVLIRLGVLVQAADRGQAFVQLEVAVQTLDIGNSFVLWLLEPRAFSEKKND